MEPSIPIPAYPYPCLIHTTTATSLSTALPITTLYLIGVATESFEKEKGRLELSSVDLTDINNPIIQLLESEVDPEHWTAFAPKLCAHYAGSVFPDKKGEVKPTRIHIQQFSKLWSFDSNALLEEGDGGKGGGGGNVKAKFENPSDWNKNVSFLSSRQFAIVGQAGESHITAFEVNGTSGQIFPAHSMEKLVDIRQPQPVKMNNITISPVAIPVHMGTTAFILDQAKDGSVVIYTITPEMSSDLTLIQASPSSLVPRFNEYMVATATPTASQIIVYSVQDGVPRFNSFDLTAKSWSGPALVTQSMPIPPTMTTPGDGSSGGHEGNNGIDSGSITDGKPSGAVIGGAIAGGMIFGILVGLFIVQRKRRRGRDSRKRVITKDGAPSGPEGAEENMPALSDYQQDLSAPPPPPHLFESSGSFTTLSSSTMPLTYIPPRPILAPPQPPLLNQCPTVHPPSIPPRPQQPQPHQQQQQQQRQQHRPRRGFSVQDIEVISFPSIHEKHKYEQEQEQKRLQREQERQQRSHSSQLYSTGRSFSDSDIYQAYPVPTTIVASGDNTNNRDSSNDGSEAEPYTLPAPFVVAPTPRPHKTELLE
ncbi:hypothetical protein KI688_003533 [Linnemannia hyalina]|uniref:Uncharacterized protein n=1 Tax=Linnemannia hyalina TaxID=64524 RepID=A0A9P8BQG1_9FUNG|nr:hypothetical protein KI688_003533 [Linnemannia hyalina]